MKEKNLLIYLTSVAIYGGECINKIIHYRSGFLEEMSTEDILGLGNWIRD
jgi:hypothetical protein